MQTLRLEITREPGSNEQLAVVRLDGKLSLETVSQFLQMLRPEAASLLVLDMAGVTFLDSAGVGALVQLFVHRRNGGQKLTLAALPPQSKAVLEVAGLLKLIPSSASAEEARGVGAA
jgi:anti-anti-sigma factor